MSSAEVATPACAAVLSRRVGVIGAGRVGAVLARALRDAGADVVGCSGASDASLDRMARLLPGVAIGKPSQVARGADLLLLTVPDDMLGNVVTMLAASGAITARHTVVHTSGAHGVGVLAPAAALGARVLAVHPSMTFTGSEVDLARLPDCAYGITAAPQDRPVAMALVAALGGRCVWISEERRSLYHAALAHGANHLVTLVAEAREVLAAALEPADPADPAWPVADADLEAVLRPLLGAALDNALRDGDAALTGPVVRGDVGTLERHVAALRTAAPQALASYLTLARATVGRATADGRLLPIRARRLLAVVGRATRSSASSIPAGEKEQ